MSTFPNLGSHLPRAGLHFLFFWDATPLRRIVPNWGPTVMLLVWHFWFCCHCRQERISKNKHMCHLAVAVKFGSAIPMASMGPGLAQYFFKGLNVDFQAKSKRSCLPPWSFCPTRIQCIDGRSEMDFCSVICWHGYISKFKSRALPLAITRGNYTVLQITRFLLYDSS